MPPKTPYDHLEQKLPAMRLVAKVVGFFVPSVRKSWKIADAQLEKLQEMRVNIGLFAERYVPLGWVNYDRMSTDVLAQLVPVSMEDGEEILTRFHISDSALLVLGHRFKMPQFAPWQIIYERAVERCRAEDWLSAIPLLLIVIDGICTSSTNKHPFSGGTDAIVFDTQTSGAGGLSEAMKLLGATRRRLTEEPIDAPYRHGIVHGLNPNFGHPVVAAKALNLLQATTDYFQSVKSESQRIAAAEEEQRTVSWREIAGMLRKNAETKAALDTWEPRPIQSGELVAASATELPDESLPEGVAARYLQMLAKDNYGVLAEMTVDYPQRPTAYRAKLLRDELKGLKVSNWSVVSVQDTTPGITVVGVRAKLQLGARSADFEGQLRMMYADEQFDPLVRGAPGGRWYAIPKFTTDLWIERRKLESA